MSFTPPKSESTRLSKDVWLLLCEYAEHNGNSSIRDALEQIVRQTCRGICTTSQQQPAATPAPIKPKAQTEENLSASAALDSLLGI
jgi:hypothetical protein